jgi:hypothetical protein
MVGPSAILFWVAPWISASSVVSQRQLNQCGSRRPNVRKILYVIRKIDAALKAKIALMALREQRLEDAAAGPAGASQSKATCFGQVLTDTRLIRPTSSEPSMERSPRPL